MTQILLVGVGGFLGAVSRMSIYKLTHSYFSSESFLFPIGTLSVNILGAIAMGCVIETFGHQPHWQWVQPFVVIGFLGAFTTFSAFSFETVDLIKNSQMTLALAVVLLNVTLCLLGVLLGGWLGHNFK